MNESEKDEKSKRKASDQGQWPVDISQQHSFTKHSNLELQKEDPISSYMADFRSRQNSYVKVEQEMELSFKSLLKEKNIEFLWQSRVKTPESLESKLRKREAEDDRVKKDPGLNFADIVDLLVCFVCLGFYFYFLTRGLSLL